MQEDPMNDDDDDDDGRTDEWMVDLFSAGVMRTIATEQAQHDETDIS
jgi:hypothetical protein